MHGLSDVPYALRERHQAIRVCDAMAVDHADANADARASMLLHGASARVADLICLVLESLGLKTMPPTRDQWTAAAQRLRDGWEPTDRSAR
jgi:hypothetical protein